MMTLAELDSALAEAGDVPFTVLLPDGDPLPAHFHITEVAQVTKDYIDCGGTRRSDVSCTLQTFVADDTDHRLAASKLRKILGASREVVADWGVAVDLEVQGASILTYGLSGAGAEEGGFTLRLEAKDTDCLARDSCGIDEKADGVQIVGAGTAPDIGGLAGSECCSTGST